MAFMNPSFGSPGSTPSTGAYDYPSTQLQQPFVGRRYPGTFDEFMQSVPQNETDTWNQYYKALTEDPNLGFSAAARAAQQKSYNLAEDKARADSAELSRAEAGQSGVAPDGGTEREMMSRRFTDIAGKRADMEAMSELEASRLRNQTLLTAAGTGYQGAMGRRGMEEANYFTNLARQNVQQAGVDIGNVNRGQSNIPTALSYGASPMRTPQSNTFGGLAQSSNPSNFFGSWGTKSATSTWPYNPSSATSFTPSSDATYATNKPQPQELWPTWNSMSQSSQAPRTNSPYYT